MWGEEVSREIPFIFSRAFSRHAAGVRVGRAGEGFVCGWKRGGSRDAGHCFQAGGGWIATWGTVRRWDGWGHSGDPQDR